MTAIRSPGLFDLRLPNGHAILAHGSARQRAGLAAVTVGDRLTVEMTPFDMSRGRVVGTNKTALDE
ncbi:MAG TPA: translation initiation factor IF-1 [Methylomirabilota bacterium]|nr:translation initiation factor IF-1 [Methylomirabilota bacterium]